MLRSFCILRRIYAFERTLPLQRSASFQPFTKKDEDDLVHVIKTKPKHVLKHVRQQVWRSRKRELHFRNTVTHLMILMQEFLRKQLIDPSNASQIMEGVLEECVKYSQHDMAHLLFRASLRFRKYGCTISIDALRFLFESYKQNDSTELMLQLAIEMREDPALRALCVAAYLFAGNETEAEKMMSDLSIDELTKDDIIALIEGYDKMNKTEKIVDILEKIGKREFLDPSHQTDIYRALFRIFNKRDDLTHFDQAFALAAERKVPMDSNIFAIILRHKMKHVSSTEEILRVEKELIEMGYVPDVAGNSAIITTFARLIHFGDRGGEELMLSKVDALLSSIESRLKQGDPDMDISAAHIKAVIRGYGAAGRPQSLKDAWKRMEYKGLTNDVRIYNELFKWFALMGNVKDVLLLKKEMESEGIFADSATYTWMLRSLGKFYPRHVEQLYDEIQERHVRIDIQLYNTLIGIFGDLGMMDRVGQLLEEMERRESAGTLQKTPITYAILIRVHSRDITKVDTFYQAAKSRNMHTHPHVQTAVLHAYSHSAEAEERLKNFLQDIPSWTTDIYNVLLHMHGRRNNKEMVNELIEKMKNEGVAMNDVTFGTLVTAFARWGDHEKVNEIIKALKEHEGEVSATFYSVLASSMNRMGDTEGVTDAWDDLVSSKLFPDTEVYNQFLALYSRQHNVPKMQNVLDNMMKHVPPNPVTATTVLDMLGKSGRVSEMEGLFEDMKTSPDTQPTSVTYHQIMNTYAKTGDVIKMEKAYHEFSEKGYPESGVTYNILMDGYGRAKQFDRMEETLKRRREQNIPLEDLTYCIMVTAYGKSKLEGEVKRLFEEIKKDENTSLFTKKVLWSFIDAFCRCGNQELLDQCVQKLNTESKGEESEISNTLALIPYYCRLGRMEDVERLMHEVKEKGGEANYTALNAIAKGYARCGRFDKSVEILHQIRDKNWVPDASTALNLSGCFLKAGLHEQAQQIIQWRRQYAKIAGDQSP